MLASITLDPAKLGLLLGAAQSNPPPAHYMAVLSMKHALHGIEPEAENIVLHCMSPASGSSLDLY